MVLNKVLGNITFTLILVFSTLFMCDGSIIVLNGLTHENQGQPGESYRGTIQIQNTAAKEKSVRVYLKDYWFSYTGESRHDPAGTLERSNSGWLTFNPELVNLAPNEMSTIDFEVKIPMNDSLKGTFWSVIMVEGIVPPDTSKTEMGVKIKTAIRYAVQIVTNIGTTGVSDLQFLGMELAKDNENNILDVVVENTGERILKPELSVELFDINGNTVGIVRSDRRKTYPGTSIKITLNIEGIKPGKYTGVLVADCDEDHIFGTNLEIEIV